MNDAWVLVLTSFVVGVAFAVMLMVWGMLFTGAV